MVGSLASLYVGCYELGGAGRPDGVGTGIPPSPRDYVDQKKVDFVEQARHRTLTKRKLTS